MPGDLIRSKLDDLMRLERRRAELQQQLDLLVEQLEQMRTQIAGNKPRRWEQVALTQWHRGFGQPIAVLRYSPEELEASLGLSFEETEDDLDFLQAAVVENPQTRNCFPLCRHRNCPSPGTDIYGHESSQDPTSELLEVLMLLGLSTDDLLWTHPAVSMERVVLAI